MLTLTAFGAAIGFCDAGAHRPKPMGSVGWTDNSEDELGFILEVSDGNGAFVEAGRAPADVTSMEVPAPTLAWAMELRICSFNEYGRSDYAYARFDKAARTWSACESFREWARRTLPEESCRIALSEPRSPSGFAGLSYLECYAAGIDPQSPDRTLLPRLRSFIQQGQLVQELDRAVSKSAAGLRTELLVSVDLERWGSRSFEATVVAESDGIRWERIVLPPFEEARYVRLETRLAP